jgi:hypothetical protein
MLDAGAAFSTETAPFTQLGGSDRPDIPRETKY